MAQRFGFVVGIVSANGRGELAAEVSVEQVHPVAGGEDGHIGIQGCRESRSRPGVGAVGDEQPADSAQGVGVVAGGKDANLSASGFNRADARGGMLAVGLGGRDGYGWQRDI